VERRPDSWSASVTGSSASFLNVNDTTTFTEAGRRWAEMLASWAIPDEIVSQGEVPPWSHDPATFAMDDTADPTNPIFELARELLPLDGGTVLDIGCGGGRSSLPLFPRARHITGVDTSRAMLDQFADAAMRLGVGHREVQGRWPDVAIEAEMSGTPLEPADVVVCHHVLFNVPDIEPFVVALTAAARLGVVVVIPRRHPMSAWNAAWKHFWNIDRPEGPTSDDAIAVLRALGIEPEVFDVPRPAMSRHAEDPAMLVDSARRRLCLTSDRNGEIEEWLRRNTPDFMRDGVVLRWPGGVESVGLS